MQHEDYPLFPVFLPRDRALRLTLIGLFLSWHRIALDSPGPASPSSSPTLKRSGVLLVRLSALPTLPPSLSWRLLMPWFRRW